MKKSLILIAVIAAALTGCATAQTPPAAAASLASITSNDLDVAIKNATAGGDADAAACYSAVKVWIAPTATAPAPVLEAPAGAFSAFEAARLKVNSLDAAKQKLLAGVPHDVHTACAPLVIDAQTLLIKLGLIAGTSVVGLPAVAPVLP